MRRHRSILLVAPRALACGVLVALLALGCDGVGKLDALRLYGRAGWQHPERVVQSLGIQPGDHVADLGAGDGYFLRSLARAVGPEGRVYAVEVEEEVFGELMAAVEAEGLSNVQVVLGGYADPLLPDGRIDLVFLCNTYHHIEDRPAYFARLHGDLSGRGRVAVVEPDSDLGGVLQLFHKKGHTTATADLVREMEEAGYAPSGSFDFLPVQLFEVFTPKSHAR